MNVKKKALVISASYLTVQAVATAVVYVAGMVTDPGPLLVFALFAGFVASWIYMLARVSPSRLLESLWMVIAALFVGLVFEEVLIHRLWLRFGIVTAFVVVIVFCGAVDLWEESGRKEEPFFPILLVLLFPQLCIAAVAAWFVF